MEISETTQKIKCDVYGCKNLASYTIKTKKMFGSSSHYCADCLKEMYVEIGKHLIPKPAKTPFKTKKIKN